MISKLIMKYLTLLLAALVVASLNAAEITLTWNDNSDNESGFIIERKTSGSDWLVRYVTLANAIGFVDNEVAESFEYSYRVKAFNQEGESGYTNEAVAISNPYQPPALDELEPLPTPPSAPSGTVTSRDIAEALRAAAEALDPITE